MSSSFDPNKRCRGPLVSSQWRSRNAGFRTVHLKILAIFLEADRLCSDHSLGNAEYRKSSIIRCTQRARPQENSVETIQLTHTASNNLSNVKPLITITLNDIIVARRWTMFSSKILRRGQLQRIKRITRGRQGSGNWELTLGYRMGGSYPLPNPSFAIIEQKTDASSRIRLSGAQTEV